MATKMDYPKMLVGELKELCTKRGLSNKGRKEELVQRLSESEKDSKATEAETTPAQAAASPAKSKPGPKSTTSTATAPQGAPDTPKTSKPALAKANDAPKVTEKMPSATDTTSPEPAGAKAPAPPTAAGKETATTPTTTTGSDTKAPPTDFTTGLASTSAEEELERRKKRMAKFGPVDTTESDVSKALERQKRFGGSAGDAAGDDKAGLSRLDAALPERRKRGRGGEEGTDVAAGSLEDTGLKRRRGGGGRGRGGRDKSGSRAGGKAAGGVAEADRIAAEKRKARFAGK